MKAAHPELKPGEAYLECPCQECRAACRRADARARAWREERDRRNLVIADQLAAEKGRMP